MNIRSTFASGKGNAAAAKKGRDSDAFKFKSSASFKRIILEVGSRTRIDKSDTRSRFISKRPPPRKLRRKATSSSEHLEDQIEDSDDSDTHDDFDLIDVDNDEDNNPSQARQSRAKTTKDQGLKTYQANLRRRLNIQRMKMTLGISLVAQRTLPFFSHPSMLVVLFVSDPQNPFLRDVLSAHVVTNPYLGLPNPWLSAESSVPAAKTRTSFLQTHNLEYSKIERKFSSVPLRLLKKVYNDTLELRNLSKFSSSWATLSALVDTRAKIFKNIQSLLMVLKVYCNVMLDFAHSNIRHELCYVMSQYRCRILRTYTYKTWHSILTWHEESLVRIIRIDQDIAINWIIRHDTIEWMLKDIVVTESSQKTNDSQSSFTSRTIKKKFDRITISNEACVAFNNNNRCESELCKWKHICIKCQQSDHGKFECLEIKIAKWLIEAFPYDPSSLSLSFSSSSPSYSRQMIMSISIEWSSKGLSYDVAFDNAPNLEIKISLKIKGWRLCLLEHSDQYFVSKLLDIIKRSASVEYIENKKFHVFINHRSTNEVLDILTVDLDKQFTARRVSRMPFPLSAHYICFPLSLIFKHDGGWRRIHDLSYFKGNSVNENIIEGAEALKYVTFDEIIAVLIFQERDAVMLKEDLANAFRHISVTLWDRWLLDFEWMKVYYMKLFLPFDLRTAPFLFDLFAKALHWILIVICDFRIVLHYLNDFLIIMKFLIDSESFKKTWQHICEILDLETNQKKKKFDTKLEFLGIELDSEIMKVRLSSNKLVRAVKAVDETLTARTLTYRQIDSLVDFLFFCIKIVVSKRSFLISLYIARDQTRSVNRSCKIIGAMRLNLQWWQTFLSQWNDVKILRAISSRLSSHIWTNASDNWSIGDFWLRESQNEPLEGFSLRYSTRYRIRTLDIQIKEMRTMLEALRQWLSHFEDNKIIIHCDNQIVCSGLIKDTMRDSTMTSLRDVVMLFALHDIIVEVKWLDSKFNHLTDLLSRGEHDKIADEYSQLQIRHDQLSS